MSYHEELNIDRYNLEYELTRQAQLYMTWALKAVRASVEKEEAKTNLELVKAQIDSKVRSDPQEYGVAEGKMSESAIKSAVLQHKRVKKYTKRYIKALKNEKTLKKAENAFNHRKKMLESLVHLNVQLHFAEPKIPTTTKEQIYQSDRREVLHKMKRRKIKRR